MRIDGTSRSRRRFLHGPAETEEFHVTSLVVHARAERLEDVSARITALPGAELHGTGEGGRLIVTLESSNDREMLEGIDAIGAIDGVVSTALVYHEVDSGEDG